MAENTGTPTSGDQATSQMEQSAAQVVPSGPQDIQGGPQQQAGAPNTPPDSSNQPSQQPQGASDASGGPQGQPDAQKPQGDLSKPISGAPAAAGVNPNSPAVHPVVQKASLIHDVAQTLAGGPRTSYAIDANTGKMTATQEPLSGRQIAQAIALAALTGGLAGLGERGSGVEGKAALAGAQAVQQQQQQKDQAAQQQASQNYARQAAIANTNFQTHQNALRLSQMELDYHKQFVGTAEPVLKSINDVGAGLASGVRESDLTNKFHVTKDMAIPDGVVQNGKNPDGSEHWENTYTVIDPNKKIELPEETAKTLADLRVPGYFTMKDGKAVPTNFSGSAPIKAGLVVNGLALAQSFQITEAQINKQLSSLGKDGDKDASQFDANLKQAIAKGSITVKGLQTIANYANLPVDQAVAAMEKDKVDPAVVQQYRQLVPEDALEQAKLKRETDEAGRKATDARTNLVITPKNAEDVINAAPGLYTPEQVANAKAVQQSADRHDISVAGTKAAVSETARTTAEINTKRKLGVPVGGEGGITETNPDVAATINPKNVGPDGLNRVALEAMRKTNPQRAALVEAIANGQRLESFYGLAKKDGQALAADVQAVDPSFDQSKVQGWNNFISKDMTPGGKVGLKIVAANTALNHLSNLVKNVTWMNSIAQGQKGADLIHIPGYAAVKADQEGLSAEIARYYKGGAPDKDAVEAQKKVLSGNPANVRDGAKELAKLLHGGIDTLHEQAEGYKPSDHVKLPAFITQEGAKSYKNVTGEDVGDYLLGSKNQTQNTNQPQQPKVNVVPAGAIPGRDPQGNIIGYKKADGTQVRF